MREPAPDALQAIAASVALHPVRTGFVGAAQPDLMQKHRAIAMEAWRIELVTPRTVLESFKVLRVGPREIAAHRDGLSINTPMVRALMALGLFDRSKAPGPDASATTGQIKDFNAKIAATPAATAHGLAMQPPQPRYTVQMWARLGYAPTVGPSPRRGLQADLIKT